MKKILILLILIVLIIPSAQSQGKWFNAPKNYQYGFSNKRDTLYIDYGNGKKIEFSYSWHNIFGSIDNDFSTKHFWNPLNLELKILKEKIKEIPLKEDKKYHITLHSQRPNLYSAEFFEAIKLNNQEAKESGLSKEKRDSLLHVTFKNYYKGKIKKKHKLTVNERKTSEENREYLIVQNKLYNKAQWQHIIEIKELLWSVKLYITDLDELKEFDINEIQTFMASEKDRFLKRRYYQYFSKLHYKKENGEFRYERTLGEKREKRPRFLKLGFDAGFGSSVIKSKLSADISAGINLYFNENLQYAAKLGIRTQAKSFGIDNKIRNNVFIDALMDINIAESFKKAQWIGAGFGYLVKREGNIYGKDTARAFFKYGFTNGIAIQPEFNFSFHDEKFLLGIGVSFNF
ncbi:hypothetical protein [Marinifilum flexuosum]|uniref:hypothetical protein n=1 Tax=Marinifilum flexuosum TaxID=1117708 RepID=UPI00248F6038|nr:hypothetical protein [Marinifilum flexuosum]